MDKQREEFIFCHIFNKMIPFTCIILMGPLYFYNMVSKSNTLEEYYTQGCGRCSLGPTPECKAKKWFQEFELLRSILLDCPVQEDIKWGSPTYSYNGKNILIYGAWKEDCSLGFFKGSLLVDPENVLVSPGPNAEASKLLRFTSVDQIHAIEPLIRDFVYQAIELEKQGVKVVSKPVEDLHFPQELLDKFDENSAFKAAFDALTPGRKKGFLFHFNGAKQSATRTSRVEKCMPLIFEGKGLQGI